MTRNKRLWMGIGYGLALAGAVVLLAYSTPLFVALVMVLAVTYGAHLRRG